MGNHMFITEKEGFRCCLCNHLVPYTFAPSIPIGNCVEHSTPWILEEGVIEGQEVTWVRVAYSCGQGCLVYSDAQVSWVSNCEVRDMIDSFIRDFDFHYVRVSTKAGWVEFARRLKEMIPLALKIDEQNPDGLLAETRRLSAFYQTKKD